MKSTKGPYPFGERILGSFDSPAHLKGINYFFTAEAAYDEQWLQALHNFFFNSTYVLTKDLLHKILIICLVKLFLFGGRKYYTRDLEKPCILYLKYL